MNAVRTFLFSAAALLASATASAQALYNEGAQYFRLKQPVPVQSGDKIEVVEVFSYACIHCAHLEPHMEKWRATMPKNAKFVGLPAIFQQSWAPFAQAYYASESLGIVEKSHSKLFDAMWVQKVNFTSIETLANWYSQFGVTAEQFTKAFTDKGMEAKLKASMDRVGKYEVSGTPAIIIDGKYRVDVGSAGGMDKVGPLINHLIAKAAAERVKK
jgi:protein dithiol oxidoreductase (disulfide-forming)